MSEIYGFQINVEGNAVKNITAIDASLKPLSSNFDKVAKSSESMFSAFLKSNIVISAFSKIPQAAMSIYNLGVEMEQTKTAFNVMLGSTEKGNQMVANLKRWADVTPFDNQTAYDAGKLLLNYGVAAKDVVPFMNMLGDASGGVKERFDRMVYAFSQVMSAGKLQGQDLRQLIDAGFNPLQTISERTGVSMLDLKEKMEKGAISSDMVVKAFQMATSEGGRFFGMMEQQSQTVGGLMSTLAGNFQTSMTGMFDSGSGVMKVLIGLASDATIAMGKILTDTTSEKLTDTKGEMNAIFDSLKDANLPLEVRKNLITDLNTNYKDYLGHLMTEKDTYDDLIKSQSFSNRLLDDKIKKAAQQEALEEELGGVKDLYKKAAKAEILSKKEELTTADITWLFGERAKMAAGKYAIPIAGQLLAGVNAVDVALNPREFAEKYADFFKKEAAFKSGQYADLSEKINKQNAAGAGLNVEGLKYGSVFQNSTTSRPEYSLLTGATSAPSVPTASEMKSMVENAEGTSRKARAGGGLGEAKVINITFSEPLMQVNAETINSGDIENDAMNAVTMLAKQLRWAVGDTGTQ